MVVSEASRRDIIRVLGAAAALGGLPLAVNAATTGAKPALFLIGDSTIRNGSFDNGATAGQFGWGHMLHYYFDTTRIDVVNDAMGGTSSRSFQTSATLWPNVLRMIQPGDHVLIAFGHNDDQGRTGPGNGDELYPLPPPAVPAAAGAAQAVAAPTAPVAPPVMVHTFGWYMRHYIEQVRAKGATPIVLSLIPRNRWQDGKVIRNTSNFAIWAKEAADQERAQFMPLNDLIADRYDALGQAKVTNELFPPNEVVHPNWAGAALNAQVVVEGLKGMNTPLKTFLVTAPQVPASPDITPAEHGEMGPPALAPTTRTPAPAA